jgi:arylsulfatase A-like enzyme
VAEILQNNGYNTAIFGKLHLGGDFYRKNSDNFAGMWTPEDQVDFARGLQNGPLNYGFNTSYILLRGIQDSPYAFFDNDQLIGNPNDFILWQSGAYGCSQIEEDGAGIGMPYWDSCEVGPILTQKAIEFIDRHHRANLTEGTNTPFFLYYASQSAHGPYTPPDFFLGESVKGVTKMTRHTDMIYEIDMALGKLIEALEDRDLIDNTLIIFTSDNGGIPSDISFGHDAVGGLRGEKSTIWEGGHRVPFIAKWGDGTLEGSVIPPGVTSEQLIGVHDLTATLAALVGQSLPADQARDSFNFLPVLLGQRSDDEPIRDHIIIEAWRPYPFSAIRMGKWKLILNEDNDISGLYNMANDLAETKNLMYDLRQKERIKQMKSRFLALRHSVRTAPPIPDIKGNDSNGPVIISQKDNLSATIQLNACSLSGKDADWWVAAKTPLGWYYYDYNTGSWIYTDSFTYISVSYQGPILDLNPFEILNIKGPSVGTYFFYFGVDWKVNGVIDNPLYYDRVEVRIKTP